MTRQCRVCGAELGPHEAPQCVSCDGVPPAWNLDTIVAVLEQADAPLAVWDISREAKALLGWNVGLRYAQYDERLCWAGRGIWGLYRHGLLPGVRTVSKAAAIYIQAAGQIETNALYFVMRRVGYRFSPNSLSATLSYEPWIVRETHWYGGGWYNSPRDTKHVRHAISRELGLARRLSLTDVLDRARRQVQVELAEYETRVG